MIPSRLFMITIALALPFATASAAGHIRCADAIQQQINVAEPGDVIRIPPGIYRGTLDLAQGITLEGAGAGETILDGEGAARVVTFGKDSVLIGFTLRNGEVLAASESNFFGLLECDLVDYSRLGLSMHGGSALIAHNRFSGADDARAVFCYTANPVFLGNLIENNRVGIYASGPLTPTLIGNRFLRNQTAVGLGRNTTIDLAENEFIGNDALVSGLETDDPPAATYPADAEPFEPVRNAELETYLDLMRDIFEAAVAEHPVILYDLPEAPGPFGAIAFYPWATFAVGASALETRIVAYDAHDVAEAKPLNAEYIEPGERPTVSVRNPELLERMRGRYVLETWYDHEPSYHDTPDGRRAFQRMTNMARIEVLLPAGYRPVSVSPDAVLNEDGPRTLLSFEDMGDTQVEIVMEPLAECEAEPRTRSVSPETAQGIF